MEKIRALNFDELSKLGIDENNKLYWDGRPIVTDKKVSLQWWVNGSAIAGALSGVVLAIIELLRYCAGK